MKPTIHLHSQYKLLTIVIPGDLTSTSVREFREEIDTALMVSPGTAAPWQIVALNLAAAKMVDSMGLNLIVKIYKTVQTAGGRMQVVYTSPNVHRTLIFTRLDHHVELIKG
jgi:anti-anti-sigma factor